MKKWISLVLVGLVFVAQGSVFKNLARVWAAKKSAPPVHATVGHAVPELELALIDGSTVSLADQIGKNVVVLDFWASWCGPCRAGLPKVQEVADHFSDTNVLFYAVNVKEERDAIDQAVESLSLTLPVGMDESGEVADAFHVRGIPHTVVIDLKGTIWSVHVGAGLGMKEQLKSDISAVLSGAPSKTPEAEIPTFYKAKPIPAGDDAYTWTDFSRLYALVLERELLALLEEVSVKGGSEKAVCEAIVQAFVKVECGPFYERRRKQGVALPRKEYEAVLARVDELFAKGVDHPALRYMELKACLALNVRKRQSASAKAGLALLKDQQESGAWMKFCFLESLAGKGMPASKRAAWRKQALDSFPAVFHQNNYFEGEERMMSYRLTRALADFFKESEWRAVTDRLEADAQVPVFIQQVADGYTHIKEAWAARGSGWGNSVSREGWMGFGEHLEAARASLTAAWEAHPEFPEAADEMITVAMGRSTERNELRKWFDRSVAAQLDYMPAYYAYSWGKAPRWGGSIGALHAFADECLATERFDTAVPTEVIDVAKNALGDSDLQPVTFMGEAGRKRLQKLLDGYRAAGGEAVAIRPVVSYVAAAAAMGGHYELAYEALKSIQFKSNYHYFTSKFGDRAWKEYEVSAVLRGGPCAEEFLKVEQLALNGPSEQALAGYDELLKQSSLTPLARERVALLRATLEHRSGEEENGVYARGEEASWLVKGGHWRSDSEGRLQAGTKRSMAWIPGRVMLHDDFEIRYTVEWTGGKLRGTERSAFALGRPDWHQYQVFNVQLHYKTNKVKVDQGDNLKEKMVDCKLETINQVRIVVKDEQLSVWINDTEVVAGFELPREALFDDPLWLGLGDYYNGTYKNKLRFYDISYSRAVDCF